MGWDPHWPGVGDFTVDSVHACAVPFRKCQVRAADHLEKELTMLNERAREIYSFIQRFRREKGSAPTIREIGHQFGISSTNGVPYYLNLLEKAAYIPRQPRKDPLELGPANEKYQPILGTADSEFRILGTVRGVVRTVGKK